MLVRFAALFLLPIAAHAQDLGRHVVGGDILYRGIGVSRSLKDAVFDAQNHAVRGLVAECGVPPAQAKVFEQVIERDDSGFTATIQVGVDIDSCERLQATPPDERPKYANHQLLKDFEAGHRPDGNRVFEAVKRGFERLGEKLDEVNGDLERAHSRLDRIEGRLHAQPRPTQDALVQVSRVSAPAPMCEAQYQSLIQSAQLAALENTPPGNMAQGRARDLYNQAMMLRASCR